MRIRLAQTAGFCMGVRRAVEMVLDLPRVRPPLPIVTYGPLIHNPQTLKLIESRGIRQVNYLEEIKEGTVVIRAHGISPQERQILQTKGVSIIDATCPRVARVQAVIRKHAASGHFCVIIGDEDHPEVRGLLGFASAGGVAVPDAKVNGLLDGVPSERRLCVVAQTTQEAQTFQNAVEALKNRFANVDVYNTICDSTTKRQDEVGRMAGQVDMIVVVGGKGSGNTRRLVKVAEARGIPALHVETDREISPASLAGASTVGVTAGASTPNWQIRRVLGRLREIGMSRRRGLLTRIRRFADITAMTYCWAALGGGGLTATCLVLQDRPVTWLPLTVTTLFVFSMHLLNRLQDRAGATRFNNPEVAEFYTRHKTLLTILAIVSSLGAVALSSVIGMYACMVLLGMVIAGGLYSAPVVPGDRVNKFRWRSMKDLPGSKTPLVALGWAVATSVLPVLDSRSPVFLPGLAVAFAFSAAMVFWRTALSDVLDVQGDRIVGRETIPILIGVKNTERLLVGLLVVLAVTLAAATAAGWVRGVGVLLIFNILVFGGCFLIYRRHRLADRLAFEVMADGNFVLAGALSIAYGLV